MISHPKTSGYCLVLFLTSCRTTFANALSNLRTLPFITDLKFLGPLAKDSTLLDLLSTSTVPPDYWILSVGVILTLRPGVCAKKRGDGEWVNLFFKKVVSIEFRFKQHSNTATIECI